MKRMPPLAMQPTVLPTFSIVIPTYRRAWALNRCLAALSRLNYPCSSYEVIVVNDGGPALPINHRRSLFATMPITWLHTSHAGPAAARNHGAGQARGDYLAFIDDDCLASPQWLRAFANALGGADEAILGGHTGNGRPDNAYCAVSQLIVDYLYSVDRRFSDGPAFFTSNNMAVNRRLFIATGGFDPSYTRAAAEDRDFCRRWIDAGRRLQYIPQARIRHCHDLTLKRFIGQHANYGKGARLFFQRHPTQSRMPGHIRLIMALLRYGGTQPTGFSPLRVLLLIALSQGATAGGWLAAGRDALKPPDRGNAQRG